ncbi:MAG TPA: PD-(D/E)XK nuclease family protein [Thermodesulfobacteriota bacterium]|nr:PD-(D/E)XK nuclease family protein [Thermodesulfobacteriota bacterium]
MPTYSHSQLSTYETCPHQYRLAYIDKIEVETEGIEAFMGSRVHDALEKLYRDLKVTKLNTLEELLGFYRQEWEKNWNGMIRVVRKDYSPEDYRRLGEKCVTDYYKRYYPFDQGKTLGLEEYINFSLEEEKDCWIRGYIDRVTLVDSSVIEIHDYKTSSRLPTQEDVNSDRQLAFYQIGVAEKWQGVEEVRLIWHYLAFDKEIRSSRTPDELHQLCQATLELIRRIETDRQFLPKEGPLCNWCDYQGFCPKRKHRIAVESLPPNDYLNEEGVVLVKRYVETRERKRLFNEEIDVELAKIEEALYAYAREKGIEAIFGSDHVAKMKVERKEKYPLKGDPSRKALDEMIKKAGKWMEVSDLNPWMLARIVSRGSWPPSLVNRVKEFSTVEETRSITVSNLKERE